MQKHIKNKTGLFQILKAKSHFFFFFLKKENFKAQGDNKEVCLL